MKVDSNSKNIGNCLLCNGKVKYLLTGHDYLYKTTKNHFDVYKCSSCGSEQIIPMPTNNELMSFYPLSYYSYNTSSGNSGKKSFFVKIREKIINLSYNVNTKKDTFYVLALFARPFFQGLPLRHMGNKKFLDVGCGDAYNVNLMSHYGWDTVGFEIGDKKNNGNIYYDTDFSKVDFNGKTFDCIRVWHVLEHVPNPNQFIKKLSNVVADNGEILLGIPNAASLCAVIFGKYWYNRDLPRHIVNYNPASLKGLLKKHGLIISKLEYNSAGGFIGSIQHTINALFGFKLNFIGNIFFVSIFFPVDIAFNFLKIGDCVSVVIKKNNQY